MSRFSTKNKFWIGLALALVCFGGFFVVAWTNVLERKPDGEIYTAWPLYFEMSQHFAYASFFAYQPIEAWASHHPLFSAAKFSYPFAADFFAGLFVRLGFSHFVSFLSLSIITSLLLVAVLYKFYFYRLHSAGLAFLSIFVFLTAGGLGFLSSIEQLANSETIDIWNYIPAATYAEGMELHNLTVSQLFPQRSMALGIPLTLLVMLALSKWQRRKFENVAWWKISLLGFFAGSLMVVHVHAYLTLIVLSLALFAFSIRNWRQWLIFGLSAAASSLALFHLFFNQVAARVIRWSPGWDSRFIDIPGFAEFWWNNWGFFFVLAALSLLDRRNWKEPFFLTAIFIFFAANFVTFQPNAWDNTKLFTWAYLLLTVPVVRLLSSLWQNNFAGKFAAGFLLVSVTASGLIDIQQFSFGRGQRLVAKASDIELAARFRQIAAPQDTVLVSYTAGQWVSMFTASRILMGDPTWLWTFGVEYENIQNDMAKMFAGGNNAFYLMQKYDIKYAVLGPDNLASSSVNYEFFDNNFPVVLQNEEYRVYDVDGGSE